MSSFISSAHICSKLEAVSWRLHSPKGIMCCINIDRPCMRTRNLTYSLHTFPCPLAPIDTDAAVCKYMRSVCCRANELEAVVVFSDQPINGIESVPVAYCLWCVKRQLSRILLRVILQIAAALSFLPSTSTRHLYRGLTSNLKISIERQLREGTLKSMSWLRASTEWRSWSISKALHTSACQTILETRGYEEIMKQRSLSPTSHRLLPSVS